MESSKMAAIVNFWLSVVRSVFGPVAPSNSNRILVHIESGAVRPMRDQPVRTLPSFERAVEAALRNGKRVTR